MKDHYGEHGWLTLVMYKHSVKVATKMLCTSQTMEKNNILYSHVVQLLSKLYITYPVQSIECTFSYFPIIVCINRDSSKSLLRHTKCLRTASSWQMNTSCTCVYVLHVHLTIVIRYCDGVPSDPHWVTVCCKSFWVRSELIQIYLYYKYIAKTI